MKKIFTFIKQRKASIIIILLLAGGAYYYWQGKNGSFAPASYMLGKVEKGAIVVTTSGSGQVSASNQVEIKPKISAEIKAMKVKAGQKVKAGELIAELDTKDLAKAVREAKNSMDIQRASLALKLADPTAEDIKMAKQSIESAQLSFQNAQVNLENARRTAQDNQDKAQIALDNAQISFDNAQRAYDNSLATGNLNTDSSQTDLEQSYAGAKSTLSSALITLRTALNAADNYLGVDHPPINSALPSFLGVLNTQSVTNAKNAYQEAKGDLKDLETQYDNSDLSYDSVDKLLILSQTCLNSMKDLEHSTYIALSYTITTSDISQTTLDSYKSTISSQENTVISQSNTVQSAINAIKNSKSGLSSTGLSTSNTVLNAKSSLESARNALTSAQKSLDQAKADNKKNIASAQSDLSAKKLSLEGAQTQYDQKMAKPRDIDLAGQRLQLNQAVLAYQDAQEDLKDAKVISPIEGIIGKTYQNPGDSGSPSTAIATVITAKKLAEVSLNEVDAAKVKAGQKATLTFSAIEDFTLTGTVAEVDTIGTITSGVVNYTVKISFDSSAHENIKPQMSVSAAIITDQKLDVLMVSNSAIKTDNSGLSYLETLADPSQPAADGSVTSAAKPENKYITVGIANDEYTEIKEGLAEGDEYIARTIAQSSAAKTANTQSGMGILGGGGVRMR